MQYFDNNKKTPGMDLQQETLQAVSVLQPFRHPKPGLIIMEEWKDIEGFPGYMVSNYGRVMSIGRDWHEERGKSRKNKVLRPRERRHGYLAVALYKDRKRSNISIHRLVAKAFINNPNGHNETNHKDGNKQNNHVDNLEWCTHSYNAKHAIETGLHKIPKGSEMHNAKLNEDKVREARNTYAKGDIGVRPLAKQYGVSRIAMKQALSGKTWKHIKD